MRRRAPRGVAILAAAVMGLAPVRGITETLPPAGAPAPNFALTTQQNDRLWLTQLRGRAVVLAFGCAACGVCTDYLSGLAALARSLGDAPGRRVFFLMVTLDPARDSPAALREFGRLQGFRAPGWLLLTEDRAGQVDVVARRYGIEVRREAGRIEATCSATLVDQAGRIRARYESEALGALGRDLRSLLGSATSP